MMEKEYNFVFWRGGGCEVLQVEVVFVCVVLRFWWQSSVIIEHLSPLELQFAQAQSLSARSAPHAAAVNLQAPIILFCF